MNLTDLSICLVTEKYPPNIGGVATSARRNARLLKSTGASVQVFAIDQAVGTGKVTIDDEDGVQIFRLGPRKSVSDSLSTWCDYILSRHARTPFTLIHSFYAGNAGYVGTLAAKLASLPSIVSARGNDIDRLSFDPEHLPMLLWTLQRADAVTCVSSEMARKVLALAERKNVFFVANSVDTTLFRPKERDAALAESLGIGNAPVIGFIGEARQKKGLAILLDAFVGLARRSEAHLLLVGDVRKSDRPTVDDFLRQTGSLGERLHIIPYCDSTTLVDYYNLLDVLVLPSLKDGMPNALLEGMACGLPVITTPLGGMLDVVWDGRNGFLVPPNDPKALSQAILALLKNPELRKTASTNALQTVKERFSHQQELEGNLAVYRTILHAKGRDRPPTGDSGRLPK